MTTEAQREQHERRRTLLQDADVRKGTTLHQFAEGDAATSLGRFSAISSPVVVGSKPIPEYPVAFSQHDPVPPEPPLGFDISAVEPCGTHAEIAASIAALNPSPLEPS